MENDDEKKAPAAAGTPAIHVHVGQSGGRKNRGTVETKVTHDDADTFAAIEQLRGSLRPDSGHLVKLWRYNELARESEYIGPMALVDFSIDTVQARFGGGKYRAKVSDEEGKWKGSPTAFRIAGPPKSEGGAATVAAPAGNGLPFGVGSLTELKALLAPPPATDVSTIAVQMAAAMGSIMTATMAAMQKIQPAAAPPNGGMKEMLETFETFMALSDRMGGGKDGGDPMMAGAFNMLATAVTDAAEAQRGKGARVPPRRIAAPQSNQPVVAEAAQEEASTVFNPAVLKPYIGHLVKLAEKQRDPFTYADVLLDQLEDGAPAALAYLMQQDTPEKRATLEETIGILYPETAPYKEWFGELFEGIWQALDDANDPVQEEPPAAHQGGVQGQNAGAGLPSPKSKGKKPATTR